MCVDNTEEGALSWVSSLKCDKFQFCSYLNKTGIPSFSIVLSAKTSMDMLLSEKI